MEALVALNESVCRCCHETIGPNDSHRGYCFDCLLLLVLEPSDHGQVGRIGQFDPYEILTHPDGSYIELGRGSMGITYQAVDTTLQFPVALKVIDLRAAGLEANRERFLREARAAARLRHPHVASVLYYGARPDGQCFYAMELVEGDTLAERVQRKGPLPVTDALEVIAQVASALQAAEEYGLVHRDLKPANLMLVTGPAINVKVIDFGLAKVMGDQEPADRITYDGFIGTPAFASPEQFSSERLDQRSDYFSLGSTLYYLLTGTPPFKADRLDELAAHMANPTAAIDRLKTAGIPAPVRNLLRLLLSAAPKYRPRNGQALIDAVAKCQRAISEQTRTKSVLLIGSLLAVLLIGLGLTYLYSGFAGNTVQKTLAVLPFDNLTPMGDKAYFADGVQDEILTNLATVADLQVISRSSTQGYRNPASRPLPAEIGRVLRVNYLVNGSVERTADHIRVTAQLVEARTGRQLWAQRYDGELTDVLTIQTQIAEVISKELQAKLSSAEKASIEEAPTRDMTAYELYLHAKELLANYDEATQGWDPLDKAVRLLNEAVSRDPNFALAWSQLADAHDCCYWYNEDRTESRRTAAENALHHALQLRPDLGKVHLEAGRHLLITTHDYAAVRQELEIARRTLPNSASLFGLLATVDSHEGQWKDALQDTEKALTLDPKNLGLMIKRCHFYQYHRQYNELRKIFSEKTATGATAESINLQKAITVWQERGDTSALHSLLDEPAGPLRAIGRATWMKIDCALADRNFAEAENCLAADPSQEFEGGDHLFLCRDFLLGYIKHAEGDAAATEVAYRKARPQQLAYMQKDPDNPNPLMVLAKTDAALGRKEEALSEGRQAMAMEPITQNAVAGPLLAWDLAEVYVLCGENESAIKLLESLEQIPYALVYGDLAKLPEWDPLRSDPRFQKLLSRIQQPIPIVNRSDSRYGK